MKTNLKFKIKLAALALAVTLAAPSLHAQLNISNADGSDLALNITVSTIIDLSQATNGVWTNPSQKPGFGTYDTNQWAVVFKYTSVNIAAGATLTFVNHITHAPVIWLVSGDVNISGNVSLDGQPSSTDPNRLTEPGPGGFRGGGGSNGSNGNGAGFGPGGGIGGYNPPSYFGSYGNPQGLPLIGGSGGSGYGSDSGGGGGGAILIAASGNITLTNGNLHANGGAGNNGWNSGSGGVIRLVANQISGNNNTTIQTLAGSAAFSAPGFIRLEANSIAGFNPTIQAVLPSNPPAIFPAVNAPSVTVLSVSNQTGNISAPADPKATMNGNPNSDDFTLVTTNAVTIWLQTLNFPTNGTVTVFIKPRNASQTTINATIVSGTTNSALWQVPNVTFINPAHTVIQARAAY